jgi:type IV pilus assembly protein PilC
MVAVYFYTMAQFTYTAQRGDGELYKGFAVAADRFELYHLIRQEGGRLVSLRDESSPRSMLSFSYWNAKITSVKEQDKILLVRNIGAMISAGLTLSRALAVIERQTKNGKLRAAIGQIESDVRRGDTLHTALAKYPQIFSKLVLAMVRAGEEGGDLPGSLDVVSEQMERASSLKKKVKSALIYPVIILIAIFGIGALMMVEVVPTLSHTFKEMHANLPFATQIIIGISDFLVQYTVVALGLVIGTVSGVVLFIRTDFGKRLLDIGLVHMPLIGSLVKEVSAARTSRTLASLLTSGVGVLPALEITAEVVQNTQFRAVIAEAQKAVAGGAPLSTTFIKHESLYPAFVGEMMAVGEETGQTSEMLKRLAIYYENEVDRKTKDMSTIIEPFLMLFIGAGVGFFAVSMITPIYSLSQNIN